MVIIAVGAHPDDIEFGCFGFLARYDEVHIIIFSAGEISGDRNERTAEAIKSAKLIDAQVTVLNYKDGAIPVNGDIIQKMSEFISNKQPEMVLVMHPDDTHQDHRNVARITLSACRHVPTVLFYEVPTTHSRFAPNYYVDITDTFKVKMAALKCFKTQHNKPYLDVDEVEGLAKYRAYNCFRPGRLFEGFMLYKKVVT